MPRAKKEAVKKTAPKKKAPKKTVKKVVKETIVEPKSWVERNGIKVELTPRIERKMARKPNKYKA